MVLFRNLIVKDGWITGEAWDCDYYGRKVEHWEEFRAKVDGSYHTHNNSKTAIMKATWNVLMRYDDKGKKTPSKTCVCWG